MIKEASDIIDNRQFQKEMREKKGLARTSSAATELNKSKRDQDNQLIPIKSEQQDNLNLGSRDPFNLIDQTKQ